MTVGAINHRMVGYWSVYLLLTTLFSYYFDALGAALFPLFAVVMLGPLLLLRQGSCAKACAPAFITAIFVGLWALVSWTVAWANGWPILNARLLLPFLVLATGCGVLIALRDFPAELWRACRITLWLHLIFFYVQLTLFLGFGQAIDFMEPITGEAQRVFGGVYELPFIGRFIRPAGLNNEPGTFVNVTFLLFLLDKVLKPAGLRGGWAVNVCVFTAVAFSFSVFGYVFLVVVAVILAAKNLVRSLAILAVLGILFAAIYQFYLYERFAGAADGGLGFRIAVLQLFFAPENWWNLALGFGVLTDVSPLLGDMVVNDLGVWFSVLGSSGFVGLLLVAVLIFTRARHFTIWDWALLAIFGLSKLSFTYTDFWLIYFVLLYRRRE